MILPSLDVYEKYKFSTHYSDRKLILFYLSINDRCYHHQVNKGPPDIPIDPNHRFTRVFPLRTDLRTDSEVSSVGVSYFLNFTGSIKILVYNNQLIVQVFLGGFLHLKFIMRTFQSMFSVGLHVSFKYEYCLQGIMIVTGNSHGQGLS